MMDLRHFLSLTTDLRVCFKKPQSLVRNSLKMSLVRGHGQSRSFLDTCYSGDSRGGVERLIAARPLGIKVKEQAVPDGFTVFTAAGGDQTAKPLKEAQHGLFSYFLMKGMEGGADSNSDNQITARELYTYVKANVVQQSGGSQVPEVTRGCRRVLVRFHEYEIFLHLIRCKRHPGYLALHVTPPVILFFGGFWF